MSYLGEVLLTLVTALVSVALSWSIAVPLARSAPSSLQGPVPVGQGICWRDRLRRHANQSTPRALVPNTSRAAERTRDGASSRSVSGSPAVPSARCRRREVQGLRRRDLLRRGRSGVLGSRTPDVATRSRTTAVASVQRGDLAADAEPRGTQPLTEPLIPQQRQGNRQTLTIMRTHWLCRWLLSALGSRSWHHITRSSPRFLPEASPVCVIVPGRSLLVCPSPYHETQDARRFGQGCD
jgi:hypothetical protein